MNSAVVPSLPPVGQDLDQLCVNGIRTLFTVESVVAAAKSQIALHENLR